MTGKSLVALAIPASLFVSFPASAQYMPHLDSMLYATVIMNMNSGPNTCLTGIAPPEKEIAEARDPAPGVMQAYFNAAQAGETRSAMFRENKRTEWTHGSVTVPFAEIDAQTDPLAVAGNRLDPEPLRFFRSGNFQTAHGQWSVLDSAGDVAGVYDAQFQRQSGDWKLSKLTVLGAGESVAPAMQYCIAPGDVEENNVTSSKDRIAYFEKEIVKNETKLAKEKARVEKAEATLAARPENRSARETVRRYSTAVEKREERLADMREGLKNALEFRSNSMRDVAEIVALTGPARNALRFRGFETTTAKELAEKKAKEEAEKDAEKAASE